MRKNCVYRYKGVKICYSEKGYKHENNTYNFKINLNGFVYFKDLDIAKKYVYEYFWRLSNV